MRFDNASTVVYYCLIEMNIINLGILAQIDAGKTSVTENLLFASGATEQCGRVDNGCLLYTSGENRLFRKHGRVFGGVRLPHHENHGRVSGEGVLPEL